MERSASVWAWDTTTFREDAFLGRGDIPLMRPVDRLCGAFRPLSKVVIILVMIRGRHRGLPVAVSERDLLSDFMLIPMAQIDRAVMLPKDLKVVEDKRFEDDTERLARRATRRSR